MTDPELDLVTERATRYASWLANHEALGVALSWSAARTSVDSVEIMDLVSADWAREGLVYLDELGELSHEDGSGREHVAWLIESGDHVALLEINGFGGSLDGVVQAWANVVPSLAGMFWNVNLQNQLTVARGGQVVTAELWAEGQISHDSPMIGRYEPAYTAQTDLRAFGLAVVESETGLRLDDSLVDRRWPLVRFAAPESAGPDPWSTGEDADADVYAALSATSDSKFMRAKVLTAEAAARSTGIDNEPAVQRLIAAVQAGDRLAFDGVYMRDLGDLGARLEQRVMASSAKPGDLTDPLQRRLHALLFIEWMPRVQRQYGDDEVDFDVAAHLEEVWRHAIWALGDSWQALRQQLGELLR